MKSLVGIILLAYLTCCLLGAMYLSHYSANKLLEYRIKHVADHYDAPPLFGEIENIQTKKDAFFEYFSPIIDAESRRIKSHRDILTRVKNHVDHTGDFDKNATAVIDIFSDYYDVALSESKAQRLNSLLRRIDTIPRALVLAQAANESAWGTSRFATTGNNYFGQWCYKKGCGIVPSKRTSGATHEVKVFDSPAASVRSYLHNINTHRAYRKLRLIRAQASERKKTPTAMQLAEGLSQYSERGEEYIREIKHIIRANHLEQLP